MGAKSCQVLRDLGVILARDVSIRPKCELRIAVPESLLLTFSGTPSRSIKVPFACRNA
jgi:hypothetical protein